MRPMFAATIAMTLIAFPTAAQDKKDSTTTWERESNGIELKFEFGKETLKITAIHGENGLVMTCKTTTDKEGVVKATVTQAEEKGTFPPTPKKGFEFSFKWKADGDKATLSEFKWAGLEEAKGIVEGEFKKKK